MSELEIDGNNPITILMADDDEEDCELTREALQDAAAAIRHGPLQQPRPCGDLPSAWYRPEADWRLSIGRPSAR